MKNLLKTTVLLIIIIASSCKKDAGVTAASTSFVKGTVGSDIYDSTSGGQATTTKVTLPFVGDQISIASTSGAKTLNLTFIGITKVGTYSDEAVIFYSPNGTAGNSIGNDDSCTGVGSTLVVTKFESNLIEGTYTGKLKKSDCTGAVTLLTSGSFKAVF
jgi:hypothetical protein